MGFNQLKRGPMIRTGSQTIHEPIQSDRVVTWFFFFVVVVVVVVVVVGCQVPLPPNQAATLVPPNCQRTHHPMNQPFRHQSNPHFYCFFFIFVEDVHVEIIFCQVLTFFSSSP